MKKLLLLFTAAAMAVSASAVVGEDIYLMGSGNGLSWESFPGKVVSPQADGSYQFTIENLSAFKMSVNKATTWDGDGEYNAGAFGYSGAFGDAVFSTAGQTVSLEAWGENQDMPYPGSYTVKVNSERTSMTVKANFTKPTNAPDVFIRGGMNSWGSGAAWKFENVAWDGTSGTWTWTGTINAGVEFKIADGSWGNINYSTNGEITTFNSPITLSYNQQNSKFSEQFVGTITLKVTNYTGHQATATFSNGGEVTYPETLYILGEVNGNSWASDNGVKMTSKGEGQFSATGVTISGKGFFSFSENLASDWSELTRYGSAASGDTEVIVGQAMPITSGDIAFSLTTGTYTISVDFKEMTMTATKETTTEPEIPPTFGLVGDGNIQTAGEWNINNPVEMKANDNVWTATYSSLPSGTKFKVAVSNTTLVGEAKWDDTYGAENNAENGGDVDVVLGEAMNAWLGSSNNWTIAEDLKDITIAFTYVADGQSTITVTGTKSTHDEPTYPENMYVVGYVNGYSWNPTEGVKMTNEGDGIFTIEEIHITGSFALTTTLATDGNDWETMNNGRIGPNGSDVEAKEGENEAPGRGDGKSWVIAAGTYNLTYTWDDEILEIELVELDPEPDPTDLVLYLAGVANDWKTDEEKYKMTHEEGTNIYTYTGTTIFSDKWKICDGTWNWSFGMGDDFKANFENDCWFDGQDFNAIELDNDQEVHLTFTLVSGSDVKGSEIPSKVLYTITTGVEGIEIDEAAPAEYYNLQGVRIAAPEKGLYIIRQGEKVSKILK